MIIKKYYCSRCEQYNDYKDLQGFLGLNRCCVVCRCLLPKNYINVCEICGQQVSELEYLCPICDKDKIERCIIYESLSIDYTQIKIRFSDIISKSNIINKIRKREGRLRGLYCELEYSQKVLQELCILKEYFREFFPSNVDIIDSGEGILTVIKNGVSRRYFLVE